MGTTQVVGASPKQIAADRDWDARLANWRARNQSRISSFQGEPALDNTLTSILEELRREGIAIRRFEDLFGDDPAWCERFFTQADRICDQARRDGWGPPRPRKDYKKIISSLTLSIEDPFVQFSLDHRILGVVNQYLGMHACCRALHLWWDRPTPGPAKETQLWHKDGDDVVNVKVFVTLHDVNPQGGPFTDIPRTHPFGSRRHLTAKYVYENRSTDAQMERILPRSEWLVCTAPARTVVFCDTCGYHKGEKPTRHDRMLFMTQYTSGTPNYPHDLVVTETEEKKLSLAQARAIEPLPMPFQKGVASAY
ncbi:MAG: hypothetical protein HYZ91_07080 [Candidatus Omnitrophica bacterium]|nr:hypothetical protein [Candidatus Omnitrophota bacterium]